MRRSAAPSQQSAKRPRFVTPFGRSNPENEIDSRNLVTSDNTVKQQLGRSRSDILKLIKCPDFHCPSESGDSSCPLPESVSSKPFDIYHLEKEIADQDKEEIKKNVLCKNSDLNIKQNQITDIASENGSKYFSVVWCKLSKKKHKKWEGDAILIVQARSVTLKDMEAKQIGHGIGYKVKQLDNLEEGSTLVVGGKEVEIISSIQEIDYKTGRCFQNSAPECSMIPSSANSSKKPFVLPLKDQPDISKGTSQQRSNWKCENNIALYSDTLVLPRPSLTHQWQNNLHKLPLKDVIIDPKLQKHLRPHQKEGIVFLYECIMGMRNYGGQGAILADEMGLGKTLQCITLIWTLLKQGPYGGKPVLNRVLIITPSSLIKNWVKEFETWIGKNQIKIFSVDQKNKAKDYTKLSLVPVLIISYEMFVRSYEVISSVNFDLIICDEGHRLKNTNIKTTSLIMSLPTKRRILLSGTPIQNDLQEFYSIVEFCNPGLLGSSASFCRIYEEPIVQSRQPLASAEEKAIGKCRAEELSRMTNLFTLRRTQEINKKYLPPKVELIIFCQPTPFQLKLYEHLLQSPLLNSCFSNSDGTFHLSCIAALKNTCNHPFLIYKNSLNEVGNEMIAEKTLYSDMQKYFINITDPLHDLNEHSGKMCVLMKLLEALRRFCNREKIVLVSGSTQVLDLLQNYCETKFYKFLRLDGSTPCNQRQDLVEKFNNKFSPYFIFLLSSKAGGVGLNLIGASRILMYDIDWNPANDLQAMSRIWRDGQTRQVHIYRLLTTGTIEEKIYQRQISKQGLSGVVVDRSNMGKVQFSKKDLKDLFTLSKTSLCATHDLLNCDCLSANIPSNTSDKILKSSDENQRTCQLTLTRPSLKSMNLSMANLMEMQHIEAPISEEKIKDPCILAAKDYITFIFESKADSQMEMNNGIT